MSAPWEQVSLEQLGDCDGIRLCDRLRVAGGWVYRSVSSLGNVESSSMCFVPDPTAQPIEEPLEEDAPVVVDSADDVGVAS